MVLLINILLLVLTSSLILFSPIFYGSVLQWSRQSIQLISILIFAIWLINLLIKKEDLKLNILKLLPLVIFLFLCFFQTLNLPNIIHETLSGKSYEVWDNSRRILSELGPYYLKDQFPISIYPFATENSLLLISSYMIFGFFLSRYITNKSRMLIILIPIIFVSLLEAIIGFYQSFMVYGISGSQGAHGTFVNRNHYAGLLEITIPLILGFAFSLNKYWHKGLKNTLYSIRYSDDVFKQISIIFLVLFLLLAIFLSKSRMGMISIFISLFFFYSNLNLFGNKYKNILWFLTISIIFFILLIFIVDINPILERFRNINSSQRILVWKDCIVIIKDFPLFGSGLGTFKYIYPLYKENLKIAVDYHYAHNDYIHLLVETGVIGFSCLMAGLIILFKDAMKFLKYNTRIRDSYGYFITLGALTGIVSILIHSLADFNLHIPSNALYFTTMIGIIYGINSKNDTTKIIRAKKPSTKSTN